jgi:hypothetical protein
MSALVLPYGVTREELIECVEREIKLRERVYPRWVTEARITPDKANRELFLMRAVRAVVGQLPAPPPPQGDLFGSKGQS